MKYIVAVSGGVDSVVLLDMLVKSHEHELVVAHFDHGIREDSDADARFVGALAKQYRLPFETERVELGVSSSEEVARNHRYGFLRRVAAKHNGRIVTAHHTDDLLETIAINLVRGTGWRGLAVLNDPSIERPLLGSSKAELYDYAVSHELEWVDDVTNSSDAYLRNRVRKRIGRLSAESKQRLVTLRNEQCELARVIAAEVKRHVTDDRYFLTMVDEPVALEVLRGLLAGNEVSLTRPQLRRMLIAIKTAPPGAIFQAGEGVEVRFSTRNFIVKYP